jgi:hypothetical protein
MKPSPEISCVIRHRSYSGGNMIQSPEPFLLEVYRNATVD